MRHFQVMAFAVAAFAASSVAHEAPRKVPDAELHRPTPMPDRIILTWSGDPATTQAVTWRTDPTIRKALAQIAAATPGPGFAVREVCSGFSGSGEHSTVLRLDRER